TPGLPNLVDVRRINEEFHNVVFSKPFQLRVEKSKGKASSIQPASEQIRGPEPPLLSARLKSPAELASRHEAINRTLPAAWHSVPHTIPDDFRAGEEGGSTARATTRSGRRAG